MMLVATGPYHAKAEGDQERYIVLIVDTSGTSDFIDTTTGNVIFSADSPIDEVKQAADKFAEALSSARGTHVAIVSYGRYAHLEMDFSEDVTAIKNSITNLSMIGGRKNLSEALDIANRKLASIDDDNAAKSVVLVSPGMTDEGLHEDSGHWDSSVIGGNWYNLNSGIYFYSYANVAYQYAEALKEQGAKIYTIGILKMMEDCPDAVKGPAALFELVLNELASEGCFYPVYDASKFQFVFEEMMSNVVMGSRGTFSYAPYLESSDYPEQYFFEEAYFDNNASIYNPSLSAMSMCLSMAAFPSNESEKTQYDNGEKLLKDIEFDFVDHNSDYENDPGMDTMGVIIGMKKVTSDAGDYTLIALVTRGSNYYSEFGGNFKLGQTGNHAGFEKAKNIAKDYLNDFVKDHYNDICDTVKLWVTGYSRGAATVNLLAGELSDEKRIGRPGKEKTILKENLFAYCFETPKGLSKEVCSLDKARTYTNIHNIINPNDLVPLVAMDEWGFTRYGVDESVIPEPKRTAYYNQMSAAMMTEYTAIGSTAVNESYIKLSEYEKQLDNILTAIRTDVREKFNKEQVSISAWIRNFGEPKSFEKEWAKVVQDFYDEKMTTWCDRTEVDFTEYDGYGVFSSAYEFIRGLHELQRHCQYTIEGTDYSLRITNTVSLVDLFEKYDIGFPVANVLGLIQLAYNHSTINFDSFRDNNKAFLKLVSNNIGQRSDYVNNIETGLSTLIYIVMSRSSSYTGVIKAVAESADFQDILNGIADVISAQVTEEGLGRICDLLLDYYETHGINLRAYMTNQQMTEFRKGIRNLLQAVIGGLDKTESSNVIWSLINNVEKIKMAHYPELCFAWVKSQDKNYTKANQKLYIPKRTRMIRINCPVDVVVKNSEGRVVAELQNDTPKVIEGSSILCSFSDDGEKQLYLPIDDAYTLYITATGEGKLNVSVNEFDEDDVCDYVENYYDIPISSGKVITMSLPREYFVNESGKETVVRTTSTFNETSGVGQPEILVDDEAREAEYSVVIANGNENGGVCYGGGNYLQGAFAMVSAAEYEDCLFEGWYEGDTLVSTERQYRFPVKGNRELTAHFAGETKYGKNGVFNATLQAEEGGFILDQKRITALSEYEFDICAIPYVGYTFVRWESDNHCIVENPEEWETKAKLIDGDSVIRAVFEKLPEDTNDTLEEGITLIEGINVNCSIDSSWNGGFNGKITITNNSGRNVTDWHLKFSSTVPIAGMWNAELEESHDGDYLLKGYDWNAVLLNGQSIVVGFTAVGNSYDLPKDFQVFTYNQDTVENDYETEFKITSSWEGGCTGVIVISNHSDQPIRNWQLKFVCDGFVNNIWNGKISDKAGNNYTVIDDGSCTTILPGRSANIGINLSRSASGFYPKDFQLIVH